MPVSGKLQTPWSSKLQMWWLNVFSEFGEVFAAIGVREPQPSASKAFSVFGEAHRQIERYAISMLRTCRPVSVAIGLERITRINPLSSGLPGKRLIQ